MKHLYTLLLAGFILCTTFGYAQVSVTASSGVLSGSYTTLKEAFDSINSGYHQDTIQLLLTANTTESASAKLMRSGVGAALYSSVLIKPSVTCSITGNIAGSLIHLSGTQNVTIDGRIGVGTTNELTITNNSTLTNSVAVQISSRGSGLGAQSDTITNCNISTGGFANGLNTFGIYIGDSTITNTATGINNNYIGIVNNTITKCRYGIYNRGSITSAATYNKSIYIFKNTIGSSNDAQTVSFVGIDCRNNDSLNIIDNNIVGMLETNVTAIVRGMDLGGNIINSNITGNFIDNIRNSTVTLFRSGQGIFLATILGSNNIIANNVISNLNGHGSGTLTNNAWGIFISTGGGIKILFNTIALTGSATTTGSTDLSGCLLLNSAASTLLEVRGNIFFNTRAPGNNAAGFSRNVHSLATSGNLIINHNIYYVTPSNIRFQVGAIGGVNRLTLTDWQTGTTQDANSLNALPGIASTSVGRCIISPSSPAINAGPTGTIITTDITGIARGLTPTIGAYEAGSIFSDLRPTIIYTLGKLPIPYANPHQLRASIANLGNDTAMASKVYVSVNGVNSILDSLIMSPIAPGATLSVDMPQYNYTNMGVDTVKVTVDNDSNNTNNSVSLVQVINSNTYSYAEPFRVADGGVGFTGATGDFVAKFPYTGTNSINQIGVNFSVGGQTLSIGIWDTAVAGSPGTNLWTSTPFLTTTGLNTIVVNPPIPITGSFFVGVRQTGTVNASFSYQSEAPIRSGTFYFTSPTGNTAWNDFAPNNPFRFMIEPRLQDADDIGAESVELPCLNVIEGSSAFSPSVTLFNFGANAQSSFIVQSLITGPVGYNSSDTFTGASFAPSSSISVNLANTFNPTTAGAYTMKVWTILPGDLQSSNDTFTYNFTVSNINAFTNSGNHLTLNGSDQYAVADGRGSLNINGNNLTIEAWINNGSTGVRNIVTKDSTATVPQYDFYINSTGNLVFKLLNVNGIDSVVSSSTIPLLNYTHVAVTYNSVLGFATLYANGEVVGLKSIIGTIVGNTHPVYIGRGFANTGAFFNGNIDEVKIWDTCRTEAQIRANIHTRLANFAHPNLLAYWRMDDGSGTSIVDASGNCHAAALFGSPVFGTSTIPLGAPIVYSQAVALSGVTNFPGSLVSMNVFNQTGTNDFYIHHFPGLPFGTQPTGVTAVNANNWIMYRYGAGTMDSSEVDFNTMGVTSIADPNDFYLFNRGVGFNTAWSVLGTANAVNHGLGLVTFRILPNQFANQFAVGANNNPLPVKLLYFTAKNNNEDVNLRWATASETDNAGFQVERSVDGKNFKQISFIPGKGQSAQVVNYALVDKDAFKLMASSTLYYRLVQTDFNGKKEVSNTVLVTFGKVLQTSSAVYPNPFNSEIVISVEAINDGVAKLVVSDIAGKVVYEMTQPITIGSSSISTHGLDKLPKGMYFMNLNVNGEMSSQKIVKQ